jgi:hypothetical protein
MLATRRQQLARRQPALDDGALVLAEQVFHALQRDGIDVPGIAGDVVHLLDPAVAGRVKAVIHAGGQPQGHELPAEIVLHQIRISQ